MSKNKLRIRSGDTVVVIAGKDKGKVGRIVQVDPASRRVKVEGVRVVTRHQKPVGDSPGGIVHKEAFIDVSNVAYWDSERGARVKISWKEIDGAKVRIDRKTGQPLDQG